MDDMLNISTHMRIANAYVDLYTYLLHKINFYSHSVFNISWSKRGKIYCKQSVLCMIHRHELNGLWIGTKEIMKLDHFHAFFFFS